MLASLGIAGCLALSAAAQKVDPVACEHRLTAAMGNLLHDKQVAVEREAQLQAQVQDLRVKVQGLELQLEQARAATREEKNSE